MFSGQCYLFVEAQSSWESWIFAKDICEAMGAKLLKIET